MPSATSFRTVPDTNIILASQRNNNPASPNHEYISRWQRDEFVLLYSDDTLSEYIKKLRELGVENAKIRRFVGTLLELGQSVTIEHYHYRHYPIDSDDIAFILCAANGDATHIISYDNHLLALNHRYEFTICKPLDFLRTLRIELE